MAQLNQLLHSCWVCHSGVSHHTGLLFTRETTTTAPTHYTFAIFLRYFSLFNLIKSINYLIIKIHPTVLKIIWNKTHKRNLVKPFIKWMEKIMYKLDKIQITLFYFQDILFHMSLFRPYKIKLIKGCEYVLNSFLFILLRSSHSSDFHFA